MPPPGEHLQLWGGEIFLFPNYFMLPMFGNSLAYRSRPYRDDPERCRFEIWSLTTYPESHDPGRARLDGRYAKDDIENWGLIPRQDMSNIERIQRGLHSRGFRASWLATEWERAVSNMHEELDRYLAYSRGNRVSDWEYATDVVVVGSGGGLCGALTAAASGLEVLVLEKESASWWLHRDLRWRDVVAR